MSKKLKLSLAAGALALAGTAGLVQADEVSLTENVASPETNQVSTQASAVTVEDVNAQAGVVSDLTGQVGSQTEVVEATRAEIAEVEAVTPEAVEGARIEAETAQNAVADAQGTVTEAEGAVATADKQVADAEKAVAGAQVEADKATEAKGKAQAEVDALSATSNIPALEAQAKELEEKVAEGTGKVAEAEQALKDATLTNAENEAAVSSLRSELGEAQKVEKALSQGVVEGEALVAETSKALADAKVELDKAKAGTTTTETVQVGTEVVTSGGSATMAEGVINSLIAVRRNGVLTTDKYLDALKALANGTGTAKDVVDTINDTAGFAWGDNSKGFLNTWAGGNPLYAKSIMDSSYSDLGSTDDTTQINLVTGITREHIKDLSLFYAALVNSLRAKVGTEPLIVTEESIDKASQYLMESMATELKDIPTTDRFGKFLTSINNQWLTTRKVTFTTGETRTDAIGFIPEVGLATPKGSDVTVSGSNHRFEKSEYYGVGVTPTLTMADIKRAIISDLAGTLYYTSEYLNGKMATSFGSTNGEGRNFNGAIALLGLDGNTNNAIGLDLMFQGVKEWVKGKFGGNLSTLGVLTTSSGKAITNPYQVVTGATTTEKPVYETRTRTHVDSAKVEALTTAYEGAVSASDTATKALGEAKTSLADIQSTIADLGKAINNLTGGAYDIPALTATVDTLKAQLTTDKATLESVVNALTIARADESKLVEALAEARSALEEASRNEITALTNLETLKGVLTEATKAKGVADANLAEAVASLAKAQGVSAEKGEVYDRLADMLANKDQLLLDLNQKLASETETLNALADRLAIELGTLEALEALFNAQLAKEKEAIEASGKVAVPIYDEAGNLVAYQAKEVVKGQTVAVAVNYQGQETKAQATKESYSRVAKNQTLPQTGSAASLLASLAGMNLLGLAGIVGKRRKG